MSFTLYRPLRPASSIELSTRASFTQTHAEELVVARVNVIEVWRPPQIPERPFAELVISYELQGEINSMDTLSVNWLEKLSANEKDLWRSRLPEPGLDCLILTFDEGKISIVAFDPIKPKTLRVIALFNFEEHARGSELKASRAGSMAMPKGAFGARAKAIVDYQNRAIATVIYGTWLAVIPLRDILAGEESSAREELIKMLDESDFDTSSSSDDEDGQNGIDQTVSSALTRSQRARKRVSTTGAVLKRRSKQMRECGGDHPLFGRVHLLPLTRFGIPQHSALDIQFAIGTTKPTLLCLYSEPQRSWAARVSMTRETVSLVAICLVVENPLSATRVWGSTKLPHDAQQIVPMDGGAALVISTNAVIYVSSNPRDRYTMAVNGFANTSCYSSKDFPLHDLNGKVIGIEEENADQSNFDDDEDAIVLTLEGATIVTPTQHLYLVSLPNGTLFQIRIDQSVPGKGPSMLGKLLGVLPGVSTSSCVTFFPRLNQLFFGSRSCDGVFVSVSPISFPVTAPPVSNGNLGDDEDDAFLYKSEISEEAIQVVKEVSLEILDVLPVFGPMSDIDFADSMPTAPYKGLGDEEERKKKEEVDKLIQEYKAKRYFSEVAKIIERTNLELAEERRRRAEEAVRRDTDLVACGSRNRSGGPLLLVQQGLRPVLRGEVPMAECSQLFYVEKSNLLVTAESTLTRVFRYSAQELIEIPFEQSPLASETKCTLLLATLANPNAKALVQVFPDQIVLLEEAGNRVIQVVPLNDPNSDGEPVLISQCCTEDDSLFILGFDGKVRSFRLSENGFELSHSHLGEFIWQRDIASVSAYVGKDHMYLATIRAGTISEQEAGVLEVFKWPRFSSEVPRLIFKSSAAIPLCPATLLNTLSNLDTAKSARPEDEKELSARDGVLTNSRVLDMIVTQSGDSLTGATRIVLAAALADGDLVVYTKLNDSDDSPWIKVEHRIVTRGLRGKIARKRKYAGPAHPLGKAFRGPLLSKLTGVEQGMDGIFYSGQRPCFILSVRGQVAVLPLSSSVSCVVPPPMAATVDEPSEVQQKQQLRAGKGAALVPDPIEVHKARGPIHAICTLQKGNFVYALRVPESRVPVAKPTLVRFCTFQQQQHAAHIDVKGGMPIREWLVARSGWAVQKVVYLPHASRGSAEEQSMSVHASTLAVVSSRSTTLRQPDPSMDANKEAEDGEHVDADELAPDDRLGGAPDVVAVQQSIDLVRAPDYGRILASFLLQPDERVLCLITADLNAPLTAEDYKSVPTFNPDGTTTMTRAPRKRLKGLLVVGTGIVNESGEDALSEGRILVLEIDHQPDPKMTEEEAKRNVQVVGRPATRPAFKLLTDVSIRGPVSAVAAIDGKIIAATGNLPCQLRLLELSSNVEKLVTMGFYDAPTCVVSLNVIRDQYVLVGDMNQSMQLLRWKDRRFELLGKTFENIRVHSTEVALDGSHLMLCAGDDDANLRVWHLQPEVQALRPRAEMNIGARVGKLRSKRCAPLPTRAEEGLAAVQPAPPQSASHGEQIWLVVMGTLAGGVSALQPIDEKIFRRLYALQQEMIVSPLVPRNAGLHPAQSSTAKVPKRPGRARDAGFIVDGRIVLRFLDLEKLTQRRLALAIGVTVETILDALLEIDLQGAW